MPAYEPENIAASTVLIPVRPAPGPRVFFSTGAEEMPYTASYPFFHKLIL